jgi:hypothetical protein
MVVMVAWNGKACEVYCGNKDEKTDGTVVVVCDRLVKEASRAHVAAHCMPTITTL